MIQLDTALTTMSSEVMVRKHLLQVLYSVFKGSFCQFVFCFHYESLQKICYYQVCRIYFKSPPGFSTNWKSFADVKGMAISENKAEYFTTKGTIIFLRKENCMYQVGKRSCCYNKISGLFR